MSSNQKTSVVDYPLPTAAGSLHASVAGDGTVTYAWKNLAGAVAKTCTIQTTPGATVADSVSVQISTTATAYVTIYYTLDGSEPTTASTVYTSSFSVAESCIVSAMARYSEDGGTTFITTAVAVDKVAIQIPVLAFNYGTDISTALIARTMDGGANWSAVPVPPIATYLDGTFSTAYGRVSHGAGLLQVANRDALFFTTRDSGTNWHALNGHLYYMYNGAYKLGSNCFQIEDHDVFGGTAILVGDSTQRPVGNTTVSSVAVLYSYDGINYNVAELLNLPTTGYLSCPAIRSANYPQPRTISYKAGVWIIALNTGYLRSTNPEVWTYYSYPVVVNSYITDSVATPWGFVIQLTNYVFYSVDAGVTFQSLVIPGAYESHVVVLKHQGIVIVMCDSSNSIMSSADGVTWTSGNTIFSYIDYLYDCASTHDTDVVIYGYFSNVTAGSKASPIELYNKSGSRTAALIRFTYPTQDYNTYGAASIIWAGDNLVVASPLSKTVCTSKDGVYWTESTPAVTVGTIMVAEDHRSVLAASGTPATIPTPTSSVPSGSYNCTTTGSTGTYTVTIGLAGYNIIYTVDGTDPNLTQQQLLATTNTAIVNPGAAQIQITAGQTKRIRAVASGFDGRRSATELDITITAVQI